MGRRAKPWLKWYAQDAATDLGLRRLAQAGGKAHLYRWVELLGMALASEVYLASGEDRLLGGLFIGRDERGPRPAAVADIALHLGEPVEAAAAFLADMLAAMPGSLALRGGVYTITGYVERQWQHPSDRPDAVRGRVGRHRAAPVCNDPEEDAEAEVEPEAEGEREGEPAPPDAPHGGAAPDPAAEGTLAPLPSMRGSEASVPRNQACPWCHPPAEPPDDLHRLAQALHDAHRRQTGRCLLIEWTSRGRRPRPGPDRRRLAELLAAGMGAERVVAAFGALLRSRDPFVARRGRTIRTLVEHWSALEEALAKGVVHGAAPPPVNPHAGLPLPAGDRAQALARYYEERQTARDRGALGDRRNPALMRGCPASGRPGERLVS